MSVLLYVVRYFVALRCHFNEGLWSDNGVVATVCDHLHCDDTVPPFAKRLRIFCFVFSGLVTLRFRSVRFVMTTEPIRWMIGTMILLSTASVPSFRSALLSDGWIRAMTGSRSKLVHVFEQVPPLKWKILLYLLSALKYCVWILALSKQRPCG